VRTSPEPPTPPKDSLSLQELRAYQQHYPYSLDQQRQQQATEQQHELRQRQALLRASMQGPIGRPGSAGAGQHDYQPLLQQQLVLQEQLRAVGGGGGAAQQQRRSASALLGPVAPAHASEPWHRGTSRWAQAAPGTGAWTTRRPDPLLPADTSRSSLGGASDASSAGVDAGSAGGGEWQRQGSPGAVDLCAYYEWADKAWSGRAAAGKSAASPAAAGGRAARAASPARLPSFNGQSLPKALAALVAPVPPPARQQP
jgi:hypothetical protein